MLKRVLVVLVPVLAAVAVAIPAVAQAEPHYYRSGTLIPAGEKVPILQWGTLTITPEPISNPATCEYAIGGFVENPAGGGSGVGQTLRRSGYNCTNAGCPSGKVTIEGKEYEKQFAIISETLPWPNVLIEESGIRTESTGVRLSLGCYAQGSHRAAPGSPGYNEQIPLAEPTVCESTEEHKTRPLNEPGKNSTVTSKLSYDAKSGNLSCDGGAIAGKISGKLKIQAYKESEVITVKNP